mmetsp:Transcript_28655/g.44034  ORF Transcript_28655/g.44034 Transcript_28655/m.44034 type:complete len:327 (-) Transcript_28655:245-1225(-)
MSTTDRYEQISQLDHEDSTFEKQEDEGAENDEVYHDLSSSAPKGCDDEDQEEDLGPVRTTRDGFQPVLAQDESEVQGEGDEGDFLAPPDKKESIDHTNIMSLDGMDIDEDETAVQRYAFYASKQQRQNQHLSQVPTSSTDDEPWMFNGIEFVQNPTKTILSISIVEKVLSARREAQRRRTERLLSMNDSCGMRVYACLSSWCDLTDRGVLLMVAIIVGFIIAYKSLDAEENRATRRNLLILGIPMILFRIFWGSVYYWVWGRRLEKRREATMRIYDGLNAETDPGLMELSGSFDDEAASSQPKQDDTNDTENTEESSEEENTPQLV